MRLTQLLRLPAGLLAAAMLVAATACDEKNDNDHKGSDVTLEVTADAVTLGAESGAEATVGLTTTARWSATLSGGGFALDPQAGTGDATLRISATEANPDTATRELGTITITAPGADSPRTIRISQLGAEPAPAPDPVTLTLDFTAGPDIVTPALPSTSADALTGRHEYTFEGYTLAIYADAAANGKFFWNDQAQYYDAPEPNKALYFSKEGAYVEFPAIDGLSLSAILYVNSTGAGELPSFDLATDTGESLNHALDFSDDGMSMTFTLLDDVTATPLPAHDPQRQERPGLAARADLRRARAVTVRHEIRRTKQTEEMIYDNSGVRRQDRLLTEAEARGLLAAGEYGVLSMCDGGEAYGIPVSYVWDGAESLYIHCAPEGRKLRCVAASPRVSFCVTGPTHVVPERFTTAYESIVAACDARIGLPEEERMRALGLLVAKYAPGLEAVGRKYAEKSFHRTQIIRLDIRTFSGKCKRVAP